MFGRPSFGVSQPNTFGFGSGSSTSFGQPNQLFGSSSSTFGSGSSGFGSAAQPIFGSPQQSSAPLFGSSSTPAFGQSSQSSGFGTSLFGNTQQPSSSGGIFGSASTSTFGQQNKPSGFGFPSSSASGLFGQNTQTQQNASSMFQSSSTGALFGGSNTFGGAQAQSGTVNKFVPVTGTDSVQKSGVVQSINTKHHCITCMKEYENKSLEELRWEDYQANRKGPQQQPTFGGPSQPFGIASTNSTLFGQTENKPVFGQSSTAFGQPSFGISPQTTTSNMFGKPSTGFGNTSTTNSFAFGAGTPTTGLFGSSTAPKPFAAPTNQPLFGSTQPPQNNFGSNIFGQPSTQSTTTNLFAKPTQQQGFMGQSTFQFGAQPQNQTNVFQTPKTNNTGFNIFGQPNTTTSTFGQPQQQTTFTPFNNFGKPAQPAFGQTTQPTFGTGLNSTSIFGNNTSKSLFTPSTNLFANSFQPNMGFNLPSQQPQQQPIMNLQTGTETQPQEARPFLQLADPYGYHPHLDGLAPMKQPMSTYTTNPKELQKYLEAPQPIAIVTPTTKRMKVLPPPIKKVNLFDDGVDNKTADINFSLKQSAKRLIIKKEYGQNEDGNEFTIDVEREGGGNHTINASKGPPLFIPPVRVRRRTELDDISSSGILTTDSNVALFDTKSTKSESIRSKSSTMLSEESIAVDDEDPADKSTNKTTNMNETPIDTCGITLTRPEYYTVPPLEKLIEHKQGDGQCLVRGFTIGRVGYGNVSFPDLMDVANLNLDELVHFRYRELTIYPDDTIKPPLGQGLNRRAQVTLDRVFPKGKADRRLITDVKTLTAINFADTLRDLCDKHGTKFLDYRPETGSWVFMVEHFSKYKYSDSDDEEIDVEATKKNQKDQSKEAETSVAEESAKSISPLKKNEEMEKTVEQPLEDIIMEEDDVIIEDESSMLSDTAMSDVGDEATGNENIEIDFNHVPSSDDLHQVKTRRDLYKTSGNKIFIMKASLFDEDDYVPVNIERDNIETITRGARVLKEFAKPLTAKRSVDKFELQKRHTFTIINKSCTVPMNKSLYNCRNYMDMAVFKGRSFKVGWGRGLILATGWNSLNGMVEINSEVKHRVQVMDVSNLTDYDPLLESLPGHLQIVLETSEVKLVNGIPFISVMKGNTAMIRHQSLANETYLKETTRKSVVYYKQILDLVVALWGSISRGQTRRHYLSKWFQMVLAREIEENLKDFDRRKTNSVFDEIFLHLTGYQLLEAAELAIRNNLPNLALLISQMNSSAVSKRILHKQIEQWKTSLALDHIDLPIQKIYMLLSGLLIHENDSSTFKTIVNACENLNWRQCIAVILWYITSSTEPISKSINLYKEAFDCGSITQKPIADHLGKDSKVFDIQYYLMLLYCNKGMELKDILNPLTHTNYAGDYRLSWVILQILTALNVGVINEEVKNIITTSFSIQLESFGMPKWAVFVLLFINDPCLRKNLVMSSLHRNLTSNSSEQVENELVKELRVPAEWIHEAKSYKTKLLNMHWHSYKHLAYTKLWYDSHNIAIQSIIPDLIINENFNIVKDILINLRQGCNFISNWNTHGGLLLDFMTIMDKCSENNKEISKEVALSIHSSLLDVCTRLQFYPMLTSKQISAVSELSKRCYIYAKLLLHVINPTYQGVINITNLEMERLIMPADYIFQDLASETAVMQF